MLSVKPQSGLNDRLQHWSEKHGLRSRAQAGFRPGGFTVYQYLALRHFIDHAKLAKRASSACFVGLQTYDSVQQVLPWGCLRHTGVSPCRLVAIQSLYATGILTMKIDAAQRGAAGLPDQSHFVRHFFAGLHAHLLPLLAGSSDQSG